MQTFISSTMHQKHDALCLYNFQTTPPYKCDKNVLALKFKKNIVK